ncbi:MAG: Flp pilus assembly complex ATPase component TadA, partial [Planctomycetes bacterium]|nr:Flp pilus assembly complex ATPase component TadA [Planctomycetota bacterium]
MSTGQIITQLLTGMVEAEASDLHLVPGYAATYRTHGRLRTLGDDPLEPAAVGEMIDAILAEPVRRRLEKNKNVDFSLALERDGVPCRFRGNVFYSRSHLCACFRYIPNDIPSFEWMGFPRGLAERIVALRNGLVIVSGVTGSGKTTTLASLINLRIHQGDCRLITVEEPIEYVFSGTASAVITQREVGVDVDSFYDGLTYGLRQDPDVILVGEIRDLETAQMALRP